MQWNDDLQMETHSPCLFAFGEYGVQRHTFDLLNNNMSGGGRSDRMKGKLIGWSTCAFWAVLYDFCESIEIAYSVNLLCYMPWSNFNIPRWINTSPDKTNRYDREINIAYIIKTGKLLIGRGMNKINGFAITKTVYEPNEIHVCDCHLVIHHGTFYHFWIASIRFLFFFILFFVFLLAAQLWLECVIVKLCRNYFRYHILIVFLLLFLIELKLFSMEASRTWN